MCSITVFCWMFFFNREFDDSLLQKIPEIFYEDNIKDISSPDVSNFLVSEVSWNNFTILLACCCVVTMCVRARTCVHA